jgi:hypothetical protein
MLTGRFKQSAPTVLASLSSCCSLCLDPKSQTEDIYDNEVDIDNRNSSVAFLRSHVISGSRGFVMMPSSHKIEINFRPLPFPFIQTHCPNIKPAAVPLMFLGVDLISTFQVEMAEDI